LVALLALLLVLLVRARPRFAPAVRWGLAAGIAVLVAFELAVGAREGWLDWRAVLPLELCDAALVLAVITLVSPRRATAEVVYFWAGSGTLLAMLTPELPWNFPRWEFVVFFGLHGLVLVAALVLVFGLGFRPRPGGALAGLRDHRRVDGSRGPRQPGPRNELHVLAPEALCRDSPRLDGPLARLHRIRRGRRAGALPRPGSAVPARDGVTISSTVSDTLIA
jgi:hypothetical protein